MDPDPRTAGYELVPDHQRDNELATLNVAASNKGFAFQPGRRYSYDEFRRIIEIAKMWRRAGLWGLADALLHAQHQLGEDFAQLYDDLEFEKGYLDNLMSVARAFPIRERVPELSPSFHMVVAPMTREPGGMERAQRWLYDAIEWGWRRRELVEQVRESLIPPSQMASISPRDLGYGEADAGRYEALFDRPLAPVVKFTTGDLVRAADVLVAAAEQAGVDPDLVETVRAIVRYYRLGGGMA